MNEFNQEENTPEPTFTQSPNSLFDRIQRLIDPYAFSILCVIVRKTYGFQKRRDKISNSQIEKSTGFERPTVTKYAQKLERMQLVNIKRAPGFAPEYTFGRRFILIDDKYLQRQLRAREEKRTAERGGNAVTGGWKRRYHTKQTLNKPSKEKVKRSEASASPPADPVPSLYKKVVELISKAHKHLTGDELVWKGREPRYGKATKQILEIVSRETPEAAFDQIRQKCAAYVAAAQTDKFLKGQGVTPVSIFDSWNKVHYKPNMLKGAFGSVQKEFPKYREMTPDQIRAAFEKWNKHFTVLDLQPHISPESYLRFTREANGYAPALVDILIEEVHPQKKTA